MLEAITVGQGQEGDLEKLDRALRNDHDSSLCGLGSTAPNPVLTTIRYFRDEYEAHIRDKKCPAKVCKPLITFRVNEDICNGCGLCRIKCPAEAIDGRQKGSPPNLPEKCIKCGDCFETCKFDAIVVE